MTRTPLIAPTSPDAGSGESANLRGAELMCMAMTLFTLNDTAMKAVFQSLPLYQSIAMRGLAIMPMLWLIARRHGGLRLRLSPGDRGPMIWRTVGEVSSTVLFLNALSHMAIGDLSAIMQSLPLLVTLAAALLFGEPLGWRRVMAILVGLGGVLMILRPGTDAFDGWSLVALASVLGVVIRDLATRRFGQDIPSTTVAFYAAASVTLTAVLMGLGEDWRWPTLMEWASLILAAGLLALGYITVVATMRVGEISFVAPFRYVSLIVAIAMGLIVFGDWPDGWTWAGAAMVVSAGIYSVLRERHLARLGRA